jgi:signal peptidase I
MSSEPEDPSTPAEPPPTPAEPPPPARERGTPWWELPALVVVAVVLAVLLKTFVVQPFFIPSDSMERTLHGCTGCAGDRVIVNKPVYDLRDPRPGDIVVFSAPLGWDSEALPVAGGNAVTRSVRWFGQLVGVVPPNEKDLIKRVIAVGGQTVQCCDSAGNVQVRDPGGQFRSLDEPYIFDNSPYNPASRPDHPATNDGRSFAPVTVPAGRLWVMGDHRSDSADSAYHFRQLADAVSSTVPVNSVIGKAFVIAWPPSRWRTLGTPATFPGDVPLFSADNAPAIGAVVVLVAVLGGWLGWRRRRRRSR